MISHRAISVFLSALLAVSSPYALASSANNAAASFAPGDAIICSDNKTDGGEEELPQIGLSFKGYTLTITGSGPLPNLELYDYHLNFNDITKIILSEGFTQLPRNAFSLFPSLREVVLPDTIEYIGDGALPSSLKTVLFPNNIKYIGFQGSGSGYDYVDPYVPKYAKKDENGNIVTDDGVLLYLNTDGKEAIIPDNIRIVAAEAINSYYSDGSEYHPAEYELCSFPDNCVVSCSIKYKAKKMVFGNNCYISGRLSADEVELGSSCTIDAPGNIEGAFKAGDSCTFNAPIKIEGSFKIGNGCTFADKTIEGSKLTSFEAGDNCNLGFQEIASRTLDSFTIGNGGSIAGSIGGSLRVFSSGDSDVSRLEISGNLDKIDLVRNSKFTSRYSDLKDGNRLTADVNTIKAPDGIKIFDTQGYNIKCSRYRISDVTNLTDSTGELWAVCHTTNKRVCAIPYSDKNAPFVIENEGFYFGAADMGPDDCLYVLWGKQVSEEAAGTSEENLVLVKYDLKGNELGRAGCTVKSSYSLIPFHSGNAVVIAMENEVRCVYDTLYVNTYASDGLNHQGAGWFTVDPKTMKWTKYCDESICGHSFGMTAVKDGDRYAVIQDADASPRGIDLKGYNYVTDENGERIFAKPFSLSSAFFDAPGQYGTNQAHLDGNTTYLQLGGVAMSEYSLAVAGKAEKVFTSDVHYKSSDVTNIYDVFVTMKDVQYPISIKDYAGVERVDVKTGKTVNEKVVWLTECNENETAGLVKIVTLPDSSYCVMWEKFIDDSFDSVRYTILDQFGHTVRKESSIEGARLSNSCVQPIVKGDKIMWAMGSSETDSVIWYTADLKADIQSSNEPALGDVNGDGKVDAIDASEVLKEYALLSTGQEPTFTEMQKKAADIDGNGITDASDASSILRYYSYLSTGGELSFSDYLSKE